MEGGSKTDETQAVDVEPLSQDKETPDNTRARHTGEIVRRMIRELPKDMRRDRWSRTNKHLCDAHQGLNANLMADVFNLVQREVGHHLRKFDAYPDLLKPLDVLILQKLQAIRGMWEKPDPKNKAVSQAWHYEISCCQGCMVARIASDKHALRNLRIALLSRTQTRLNHAPRRLMKFVDTCIDLFPDDVDELYGTSSQFAFILKDTRKACSKAWANDPAHADSRTPQRRHTDHDKIDKGDRNEKIGKDAHSHQPASEYDPRKKYPQPPPPITLSHPTERAQNISPDVGPFQIAVRSSYHTELDRRSDPNPERITRFLDFADDNYQGLGISTERQSASTFYGHPGNPPSPSTASTLLGTMEEIDKLLEMYKGMGANPYSHSTQYCSLHGGSGASSQCRSPSIYSTGSEWSDEDEDWRMPESGPAARTTWNLLCEQSNMI
ncbi:hypothetical protein DTO027I6_2823 [Penicillium roqueforti]|nr:hypothetical protein CBS147337_3465 [Penicillium roqueforti]KAI2672154.1 hypothetical protein CBS147355_8306 [Penicillium roqueforti]KAI3141881.1 hypothetical protein CBS147326_1968 [Penicillium roqueforti]KAI3172010.1 hypothetical protein CBS147317_1439 [Penicillium roqueforti]KAI3215219.1 hypothetical protein DTO027I6_2823 [Penicillium roqueforti]